jgi:hypothetical protein
MPSRTWNGSTSNYLDVALGTQGGQSAQCAWIQVDSLGTLGTIFGNRFDAGYAMQITAADELELSFQESGTIYHLNTPLTIAGGASQDYLEVGTPLFVAVNVTHSVGGSPPVTADFYAGQTPETVAFIGSDSAGTFIATNGVQHILIGANNFGSVTAVINAKMMRLGRWTANLTLAEFQSAAACDNNPPQQGSLAFFFPITGASPEPNFTGGPSATVIGTLPVTDSICVEAADQGYFAMII